MEPFAYRRWGNANTQQPPLFFLQHFRGGLDNWDPLITDGLAAEEKLFYSMVEVSLHHWSATNSD
jgi:hypothetical protein